MEKELYLEDIFISKIGISKKLLLEWQHGGLINPAGRTEENIDYFTGAELEKCIAIKKFHELGYSVGEISKIIKKVGLPTSSAKDGKEDKKNFLTVGQLAEKIGVSPRTIKHWEDIGIIEADMRTDGGFRLYSDLYVYLCNLVKDLQLFGYSLDEIKTIAQYFKDFLVISKNIDVYSKVETDNRLTEMADAIEKLFTKMTELKTGILRWEDLLKKKKKEIIAIKTKNAKRI